MNYLRNFIVIGFLAFVASPASAQKTFATLGLQLSFPQDEYQQTYDAVGAGLRFNVMHRPKNGPLSIGGEFGFLINGSDSRSFDVYYLGFYDRYRISATNNILSLAFKTRADLVRNPEALQLFIDGTIGTNFFFSSVDVSRETFYGQSQYAGGNSTKGHWSFVWGPGVGIEIPLGRQKQPGLLLKGSYLFGSNAKYLTDPYIDNDGEVYFTQRESETTMLLLEIGVRFGLNR